MSRQREIPRSYTLLDLMTRIDNLLEIQIETSRRTNELLEMLLGIRKAPPKVVVVPPAVPPAVPISEFLDMMEEILEPVTDYLSEELAAPVSPSRKEYDLNKELRRSALNGYIVNDGPGDLEVKINRVTGIIKLTNGEVLDFNPYFKRPLEMKYVEIRATAAANYRILLW